MKFTFTILSLLVAACAASCPNDCNGNGICNRFNACECYRNWETADCSQRTCLYGNAFIDTPQGDLNGDGRVDRPDVYAIEFVSSKRLGDNTGNTDTNVAPTDPDTLARWTEFAETFTIKAGTFIYTAVGAVTVRASESNNYGTVAVAATGRLVTITDALNVDTVRIGITLPVTTWDGKKPADGQFPVLKSGAVDTDTTDTAMPTLLTYSSLAPTANKNFVELQGGEATTTTHLSGSVANVASWCSAVESAANTCDDTEKSTFIPTGVVTSGVFQYSTQFTNSKTFEKYPSNHGIAVPLATGKSNWDEAHFYTECSGKGICDRSTGTCECFVGYEGEGCTRTSCPNDCAGHGVCNLLKQTESTYSFWDASKTQTCKCDAGYRGIDCSLRICPKGDDPITREAAEATSTATLLKTWPDMSTSLATIAGVLPRAGSPEIQIFGYTMALDSGHFALEFTDEFGNKWVTKTMDFKTVTEEQIASSLTGLPNAVISAVSVNATPLTASTGLLTPTTVAGKVWAITFTANSGDIPPLGVRYTMMATGATGDDVTVTDDKGKFGTLAECDDACTTAADDACTAACIRFFNDGGGTTYTAGIGTMMPLNKAVEVFGSGLIIDANGGYSAATGCTIANVGSEFDSALTPETTGTGCGAVIQSFVGAFITEARKGTQENAECSNRGLCDDETGLCKCFNGFTDDDCSIQNALAMY